VMLGFKGGSWSFGKQTLAVVFLVSAAHSTCFAQTRWVAYYAANAPAADFGRFSLIVLDSDRHPPLEPLSSPGKTVLGYLSLGEIESGRSYFPAVRSEGILLQANRNWKSSYFVDVRNPRWKKRVIEQLIPEILKQGFDGVFLDTLDDPPYLEKLDSRKNAGMTAAAVDLVVAIRQRFPSIKIMMNRGYELLPGVEANIDYVLGESVFAAYDFEKKVYRRVPPHLYEQQAEILKAAQLRRPQLQVFTLDYWDTRDARGIAKIYEEERKNGFIPYVATVSLDRIISEPPPSAPYVPRTILALYDSRYDKETRYLPIHQIAEMPLNHLGLLVRYQDINKPLPGIEEMQDVRGVLTWFRSDQMADPAGFLKWLERAMDAGKKLVVIGDLSASFDLHKKLTPPEALDRVWSRLGLKTDHLWTTTTYDWEISRKDSTMVEFERALKGVLPGFPTIQRLDSRVNSYLSVRENHPPRTEVDLITIGPSGAYAATGYVHFSTTEDSGQRQWYLNPFEFFREAYVTDRVPKLDTNTLSGRRIFYSHIDGDGWRNLSEVPAYKNRHVMAAEVVLKEVIQNFSDLPITVAPVVGDLDPDWYGTRESHRVAKAIFASPNVEAGSHTYGHPLRWDFLSSGAPEQAGPSASRGIFDKVLDWLRTTAEGSSHVDAESAREGNEVISDSVGNGSKQYRTYNVKPFSLALEINDSVRYINGLLPPGKRVEVLQWSGNTTPSEQAIAGARAAGVRNINGGDTRFDPEFHSYGWVAAVARQVGNQHQVYASNSNENTYTELWSDRFFGFKYLSETLKNTETPIRVKPHNIYFHMYSGEKLPSLLAVQSNYQYAQKQELTPITTATYAAIVDGFYSGRIVELDKDRWRIEDRGALQTVRFDHSPDVAVDFSRSSGVLGQRIYQDSLYIALDPFDPSPVLALNRESAAGPYLSHARWLISGFKSNSGSFTFKAQGFGDGETVWKVLPNRTFLFEVRMKDGTIWQNRKSSDSTGMLRLDLGPASADPVEVRVRLSGST
jgi:polysaccharide biosynthesis protein PelA